MSAEVDLIRRPGGPDSEPTPRKRVRLNEQMRTTGQVGVMIAPTTLWLFFLLVLPLIMMTLLSFRSGSFTAEDSAFTLSNYQRFLQDAAFQRLMLRSLWVALLVALYSVVLAYPLAYYLAFRAKRRQNLLLTLLIIPAWTSFLLRVLAWRIILGSDGMLNSLLLLLGLTQETLPILLYSPTAVIVTLVYVWIPFAALPIYVNLQRIDLGLLEGAADLGATPIQAFMRITLPLSMPGIIAALLFVFIPTVGEYVTPALVGGPSGQLIGNIIWDQFARALNWPMGSVLSLMMLVLVLLPLLLTSRLVRLSGLLEG